MSYTIQEFDPKHATKEFWDGYMNFINENSKEMNPDDPLPNRDRVIKNQQTDVPEYVIKRWLVFDESKNIIGWTGCGFEAVGNPNYEQNKHILGGNIVVIHTHRRQGVGTSLLKKLCELALKHNRSIIEGGTNTDAGRAFCTRYNGKITIEGAENRLKWNEIDWDLMQQWIEEGKERASGVIIRTFSDVPEEMIEEYVTLYTEIEKFGVPLGETEGRFIVTAENRRKFEEDNRNRGNEWITMISVESDGKISGLTEIFFNKLENHLIRQELTGVKKEYQGRGLGKWLKAEMLFYIRDRYPGIKYISTGNANENAPMLSINHRMGFKFHRAGSGIKFDVSDLKSRL